MTSDEYSWLDSPDWLHPFPVIEVKSSHLPRNGTFSRLPQNGTITKGPRPSSLSRLAQRSDTFRFPSADRGSRGSIDSDRASGDALSNETYHCLDPEISFPPATTKTITHTTISNTTGATVERTKTFTRRKLESEYRSVNTFTKPGVRRTGTFKARANGVTGPQHGYNNNFEYFRDLENGGSSDRLASDENLDLNDDLTDNQDPMNSTFTLGNETIDKFNHNTYKKPSSAFQRNGQTLHRPTVVSKTHVEPKIMPMTRRPQIPVKPASLTRIPGPRKHNF